MLNNIRIVLVRTFHPGNIGSTARAMKTMGLTDLHLVAPLDFPSNEATKMSASANDVLLNATINDHLYDSLKDCSVVIASTARPRGYDLPELNPQQCAHMLLTGAQNKQKVALVFGPERMGLSNDDCQLSKYRVSIPTHPDYSSLNLAAAVQTLSYEIYKQSTIEGNNQTVSQTLARELPSTENVERFYQHLEDTLMDSGFIIKNHPGEIMQKFRTLFDRAEMDVNELNILRGALASVQRKNSKENNS